MWTNHLLKQNARFSLRGRYWIIFAACLIYSIAPALAGGSAGLSVLSGYRYNVPGIVSLIIAAFLLLPLRVGLCRLMMENRLGDAPFESLFSVFRYPYLNIVRNMFLLYMQIFLGFIIIIPGVLWFYRYFMVPYILAENPYMPLYRAKELSRGMTAGEKLHIFGLQLSFLGWYILGTLCFGIGTLFVTPYYEATMAELYAALRAKAFALNITDESELGDFIRY